MKKIVFLIMMSLTFSAFSSNSISSVDAVVESITNNKIDFNLTELSKDRCVLNEDFDWGVRCYVTVINSVTGQSVRVYATGTGATPGLALANCGENARENARILYGITPPE